MALHDLTPQLRTRLSRVERTVGWFVMIAVILLVTGFVYYVWHTAKTRGWFVEKVLYQTSLYNAAGIKVGDPVKMVGYDVGKVTEIIMNEPTSTHAVTIRFVVLREPTDYIGYIWSDSQVRVAATDFLGGRTLEIMKGITGVPTVDVNVTNNMISGHLRPRKIRELMKQGYDAQALLSLYKTNRSELYTNDVVGPIYLFPEESPALTERLEKVATMLEKALPNFLALTNRLNQVLSNSVELTGNLNGLITDAHPAVDKANDLLAQVEVLATNLTAITENLKNPNGSLGDWLIPTNINAGIQQTISNANATISHADTNLIAVMEGLDSAINNLANITSNLNAQVQSNTNMLTSISTLVVDTDNMVQGLKRHWLLRSAFKTPKTNAPPAKPEASIKGGKK